MDDPTGARDSGPRRAARRLIAVPTPAIFLSSIMVAVALLVWQGTLGRVAAVAETIDWRLAALAAGLYACGLGLLAFRWHALVRMAGGGPSAPVSAEVFLTSVVVNYAAPIGLAAPARAALSKRDLGLAASGSGAVVLWEAALDLGMLAVIGSLWLALGGIDAARLLAGPGRGWAAAMGVAAAVAALAVAAVAAVFPRARAVIRRLAGEAIGLPARRPRWAAAAALLTVVFWLLQLQVFALLLAAVGQPSPAVLVLGLMGWPLFAGMVSPLPGGAGVREALMVGVAGIAGADGAAVLLAALLYRLALVAGLPVVYGLARLWRGIDIGGAGRPEGATGRGR